MRTDAKAGTLIIASAAVHEFIWQAFPVDLQGDIRAVTQLALILAICWVIVALSQSKYLSAAATATVLMSSTTAACSAAWLVSPWEVLPGQDQCSAQWGFPMLLVSGIAALLVVGMWPEDG